MIQNFLTYNDPIISSIIEKENERQFNHIELIASENFTSKAVMQAQGSILTNKYAEGYPGKRYYGGCMYVDEIEEIAIERVKKLFKCDYANVQPHSGSQANQAVFMALLNPGDTILGMSLDSGGHLTHGAKPNLSGKWFNPVHYNVSKSNFEIDYDEVRNLAFAHKPKIIICGYSAYPRKFDFKKFKEIADDVGAYLMADIAHISGLVAAELHESPFPYADVVTSTTHKTLRGPRGGIILTNNSEIAKKVNLAIFPGIQGGPLMHVIAAKAVSFGEALKDDFKEYIQNVLSNAKILAKTLMKNDVDILTNGTDTHLMLIDLRKHNITGKLLELELDKAHITCNKNAIPYDHASPFITSGIRIGTAACTTRGFRDAEFIMIGDFISEIINAVKIGDEKLLHNLQVEIKEKVINICRDFPVY